MLRVKIQGSLSWVNFKEFASKESNTSNLDCHNWKKKTNHKKVGNQTNLLVWLVRQEREDKFQLGYKESNTKLLAAITKILMEIFWHECEFWCFASFTQNDMNWWSMWAFSGLWKSEPSNEVLRICYVLSVSVVFKSASHKFTLQCHLVTNRTGVNAINPRVRNWKWCKT